jgi:hypothetical protein
MAILGDPRRMDMTSGMPGYGASAGILGASQPNGGMLTTLGGQLGDWFRNNPNAIMGLAANLLQPGSFAGNLGAGLQAYQAGTGMDENQRGKREEKAAFQEMATANKLSPQEVKMGLASEGVRQALLSRMMDPKAPIKVNAGDTLLDPTTMQPIYQAPSTSTTSGPKSDYQQRVEIAASQGMQPGTPEYNNFVLYGKPLREDQQPLTSTDKKAILEADEMVSGNQAAIDALERAKKISPNANEGWTAASRAWLGNNLPDFLVPDGVSSPDSSLATVELDNAVVSQALAQLKTIFGGAPTEGERKILLDLQGSSSLPDAARQKIFDAAIEAAKRRLAFNKQRADEMRGGTYYKPGSTTAPAPNAAANVPAGVDPGDWEYMTPEQRALFQ